jgi:dihydroneopterin aldolase
LCDTNASRITEEKGLMDIIFLRGLHIETTIGIYDWERVIRQVVILDLEMGADIRKAAASDDIADTLDYKALSKRVIEFVESSEFLLVETLAEKVAELLRQEFAVPWLRLSLNKKGAISGASDVGIIIERGCRPADA